jgi:hypothetical protein
MLAMSLAQVGKRQTTTTSIECSQVNSPSVTVSAYQQNLLIQVDADCQETQNAFPLARGRFGWRCAS